MKYKKLLTIACTALGLGLPTTISAQTTSKEVETILPASSNINVSWDGKTILLPIRANNDYTVSNKADWLKTTITNQGRTLLIKADSSYSQQERTATIALKTKSGNMTRNINITQGRARLYETVMDKEVKPTLANASSSQSGRGIEELFDNNTSTYWHSFLGYKVTPEAPATVTVNFSGTEPVDYMVYTPRQDYYDTGTWRTYTVTVEDHGQTFSQTINSEVDKRPDTIRFQPALKPNKITITITSGYNNYASGAELHFYRKCDNSQDLQIFADDIYSGLRDGVTQADIDKLRNPFCKDLATRMFNKTYDKSYRVSSYPCRLSYRVLSDEWNAPGKYYSQIDNPTGLNFRSGDERVVFVSGLPADIDAKLCIVAWYVGKDGSTFDGADPHTTDFTLKNGINIIKYNYEWDGLGYIKYYADTRERFEQGVPNVRMHFIDGEINGILTPDKTNEEMYELCRNAADHGNLCIDLLGEKVQSIWTSAGMRDYCKAIDGSSLGYRQYLNLLDSIVTWEHRLLGLEKYNRVPENHTLAYTNYQYYMFQGGLGVSFHHNQESRVLNCRTMITRDYDAIWGFSHEWGHQHQMHPYFAWAGLSEVSNNIFSYYNEQRLGYTYGIDRQFARYFWDNNFYTLPGYNQGRAYSKLRSEAYRAAVSNSSLYSYSPELRQACLDEKDSLIYNINENPSRSVNIYETTLFTNLSPFNLLGNYAAITLNYPDFFPDLFESLRQQNNLPAGSTIEKQGDFDKYELISAAQNGNVNQLYSRLQSDYPNSCWITSNYLNSGRVTWQNNSVPALFCFVRKASRLLGYNLYDYFERAGFFRIGAYKHGDYGTKYSILTQKMLDEFKEEMTALETSGEVKPMTEEVLYGIFHERDYNKSATDKLFPTPDIPN